MNDITKQPALTPIKMTNRAFDNHGGFSLIELLVAMLIMAILATMAVPAYQQYAAQAKQEQVKIDMLQLASQLEAWRSQTLSYGNFQPAEGYDTPHLGQINSPAASDSNTADYYIQLRSISNNHVVLLDSQIAINWVMLAIPNNAKTFAGFSQPYYILTSQGIRCQSKSQPDIAKIMQTNQCNQGDDLW